MSLSARPFLAEMGEDSSYTHLTLLPIVKFSRFFPFSLMHSAVNVRLGATEQRPLLYVASLPQLSPDTQYIYQDRNSHRGGCVLSRLRRPPGLVLSLRPGANPEVQRRCVHLPCIHAQLNTLPPGKYLLEREKLVKENAWKLDD